MLFFPCFFYNYVAQLSSCKYIMHLDPCFQKYRQVKAERGKSPRCHISIRYLCMLPECPRRILLVKEDYDDVLYKVIEDKDGSAPNRARESNSSHLTPFCRLSLISWWKEEICTRTRPLQPPSAVIALHISVWWGSSWVGQVPHRNIGAAHLSIPS